jgi:hypothetical protein
MAEIFNYWWDGEAGVSWFSGTHPSHWVLPYPKNRQDWEHRVAAFNGARRPLLRAALRRLRGATVILTEDLKRGRDLLVHVLQLSEEFSITHENPSLYDEKDCVLPQQEKYWNLLAPYMPMDRFFYAYASELYAAQLRALKLIENGTNISGICRPWPAMPELPSEELLQPKCRVLLGSTLQCEGAGENFNDGRCPVFVLCQDKDPLEIWKPSWANRKP